jgi:hypothetical protein
MPVQTARTRTAAPVPQDVSKLSGVTIPRTPVLMGLVRSTGLQDIIRVLPVFRMIDQEHGVPLSASGAHPLLPGRRRTAKSELKLGQFLVFAALQHRSLKYGVTHCGWRKPCISCSSPSAHTKAVQRRPGPTGAQHASKHGTQAPPLMSRPQALERRTVLNLPV